MRENDRNVPVRAFVIAVVLSTTFMPGLAAKSEEAGDRFAGATIRYTWTEGPVTGVTHEHVFGRDGTVVWRVLDGPQKGKQATEKRYSAIKVTDEIYAVSYLAASGSTLTVIMNFRDLSLVGFASDARSWYPLKGTFQIVASNGRER